MSTRTFFPVYTNWGQMIEEIAETDLDTAKELSYAIIHYSMTKEIITFSNPIAQAMFKGSMLVGMDNAEQHYINGKQGGAPKIEFTAEQIITAYQQSGTWDKAAKQLGVDPKTLRDRRTELGIDKKGKMGKIVPEKNPEIDVDFGVPDVEEKEKWENGKKEEEEDFFPLKTPENDKEKLDTIEWYTMSQEEKNKILGF